jgi:hypothetical protein
LAGCATLVRASRRRSIMYFSELAQRATKSLQFD